MKKQVIIILIGCLLGASTAYGQSEVEFVKNSNILNPYGFMQSSADNDGNIYVAGEFDGFADVNMSDEGLTGLNSYGESDIQVMKMSSGGNVVWAKQIGGTNDEFIHDINVSGNQVYISTRFSGVVDVDPGPDSVLVDWIGGGGVLTTLDLDGNYLYHRQAGWCFLVTGDDNAVVYTSHNGSSMDLVKMDHTGLEIWNKTIQGYPSPIDPEAIILDGDGNVYVAGAFNVTTDFDPDTSTHFITPEGHRDFILKLDADGEFEWVRTFDMNGIRLMDIKADSENNTYVAGHFKNITDFDLGPDSVMIDGGGNTNGFVMKLDTDGEFQWVETFMGSSVNAITLNIDASDRIHINGYFKDSIVINGSEKFTSPEADNMMFLSTLTTDGFFISNQFIQGEGSQRPYSTILNSEGSLFVTGIFSEYTDFSPREDLEHIVSTESGYEPFIAKYRLGQTSTQNIHEDKNVSIKVWPNPTLERAWIQTPEPVQSVHVYGVDGELVMSNLLTQGIDLSNLPIGLYILKIVDTSGNIHTEKVVKN